MDEGEEELMPQDTQWKVQEVQEEDKGTSPTILTWGLPVAYVVAGVLLGLIISLAMAKVLRSRKKASLAVTPVTQIATIQLRNGDMCNQTTELGEIKP